MKLPKVAIAGIAAGVIVVIVVSLFGYFNSVRNTIIDKEEGLTAAYKANMVELDKFTSSAVETMGVAGQAADKIGALMAEAISGRYAGESPQAQDGKLFSALVEAYPDFAANTALYGKAQDQIIAGRQAFADAQTRMASMVADYRKFVDQGLIRSSVVSMMGAPTDRIRITVANKVAYEGTDALTVMETVIMSTTSAEAVESGTLEPLTFTD